MSQRVEPKDQPLWRRALTALQTEVAGVHPTLHAYNLVASLLPPRTSGSLRARLLELTGIHIGAGSTIDGSVKISGPRGRLSDNLSIGEGCSIGDGCVLDLSDKLTIGHRVTLEPGVMILTSTHELDFPAHRAGPLVLNPVSVGDGAWLRARAIILPNVKIGEGAVVEAGAVVNKDVAPHTRVGGSPAVKLGDLEKADGQ
jgi:maltose O-acetyltransferase